MTSGRVKRLPVAVLAAFGLGLVACPLPFIARGALRQFSPAFSLVTLPPFVAGGAFLLWRHLYRTPTPSRHPLQFTLLEILSWIAVGTFTYLLSGINLLTPFERAGAVCTALLITSTLFLPIVLVRRTSLEQRLVRLGAAVPAVAALLLLVAVGSMVIAHLCTPSSFIGGPRRPPSGAIKPG